MKRSYRELVKVWHPDRFADDPKLQKKAQEKLKQINSAYERICEGEAAEPSRRPSSAGTNASQAEGQSCHGSSNGSAGNRDEPKTEAPRQAPPPRPLPTPAPSTNWGRRIVQFAVTVVIIAVIKAVFSTSDRSSRQTTDYTPPYNPSRQSYSTPEPPSVQPQPKARQHLTIGQILELHREALKRRRDLRMSVPEFSRYMQANQAAYDFSEGIAHSPPLIESQPEPVPSQAASAPILEQRPASAKSTSSADDPIASAEPAEENTKKVEVAFAKTHDSVSPIPSSRPQDFFTVGSTRDEVLAVQGTPDQISDRMFTYGYSRVVFNRGRVESWRQSTVNPLKAK